MVVPVICKGEGSWTVPAGCTQVNYTLCWDTNTPANVVRIILNGSEEKKASGRGGSLKGTINVSEGDVLTVNYECPTEKTKSEVTFIGASTSPVQIAPPPPADFTVTKTGDRAKLSWSPIPLASSFIDHYEIYQTAYNPNGYELYGGRALVDGNLPSGAASYDISKRLFDYRYLFEVVPVKNGVSYESASMPIMMQTPILSYELYTPGVLSFTVPEGYNIINHQPRGTSLIAAADGTPLFRDPFAFPEAGIKTFQVQAGQEVVFEYLEMTGMAPIELTLEADDSFDSGLIPGKLSFAVKGERDIDLFWEPSKSAVDGYDLYILHEDYTEKVSLVSGETAYSFNARGTGSIFSPCAR